MDAYDDKLRSRLAEIRASAGVPHAQISVEVLYFLPEMFLKQYQAMFSQALKSDGGEDARNRAQAQVGEVGKATGGRTGGQGRRYKKSFIVLDERALELKSTMDKRLRTIARDIRQGLAGEEVVNQRKVTQCIRCGTFLQGQWRFCPLDGTEQPDD